MAAAVGRVRAVRPERPGHPGEADAWHERRRPPRARSARGDSGGPGPRRRRPPADDSLAEGAGRCDPPGERPESRRESGIPRLVRRAVDGRHREIAQGAERVDQAGSPAERESPDRGPPADARRRAPHVIGPFTARAGTARSGAAGGCSSTTGLKDQRDRYESQLRRLIRLRHRMPRGALSLIPSPCRRTDIFGVTGMTSLFGGGRGRTFEVTGVLVGPDLPP